MNVTAFKATPVVLEGHVVRLEPLAREHARGLAEAAALGPESFRWLPSASIDGEESARRWIGAMLDAQARGVTLPFATIHRESGRVIGTTRFLNIDVPDLKVEIGSTWLARPWQRSGTNREAKALMLCHAFETWGVRRVEFKTDSRNQQSRTALARLGAVEEGTLRKHLVLPDGSPRDSVYFSILDEEWPEVRRRLGEQLGYRL